MTAGDADLGEVRITVPDGMSEILAVPVVAVDEAYAARVPAAADGAAR